VLHFKLPAVTTGNCQW